MTPYIDGRLSLEQLKASTFSGATLATFLYLSVVKVIQRFGGVGSFQRD